MAIISTSTQAFFERSRFDFMALRSQAESLQAQLSRGKRLMRSSDDPVAASRLRQLSRLDRLSQVDQFTANRANTDLMLADAALASIAGHIARARELAVLAGNPTLAAVQLGAISTELEEIHRQIVSLANSRDAAGHALFGGETEGEAYVIDTTGHAVYVGGASSGDLPIAEGQSVTRSLTGPEFLAIQPGGSPTDTLAVIKNLAEALKDPLTTPAVASSIALEGLDAGLDAVVTGQTIIGARLAWVEQMEERRTDIAEFRAAEQSLLGETDLASTIADLQQVMLVLQASQASFARLAGLSLFAQLG